MKRFWNIAILWCFTASISIIPIFGGDSVMATPMSGTVSQEIPPQLRPWIPWVIEQIPNRECAHRNDRAICHWPSW